MWIHEKEAARKGQGQCWARVDAGEVLAINAHRPLSRWLCRAKAVSVGLLLDTWNLVFKESLLREGMKDPRTLAWNWLGN